MLRLFVVIFALCLIKDAFPASVKNRCSDAMDIAFILDASTDHYVTADAWKAILSLAKKIVDALGASEKGNHYAVMTFSKKPHIEMKFYKSNKADYSSEKINAVIGGLKRQVNYTYIDKALEAAKTQLFTPDAGMRKNARKVAIVITDGIQTKQEGDPSPVPLASEALQSEGVEVYAIGVGFDMDVEELLKIASSEDNVFAQWYIGTSEEGFTYFKSSFCGNA